MVLGRGIRVLTLTWEFPPFLAGGLGMACYGLVRALLELEVQVILVLPSEKPLFFELTEVSQADSLPAVILDRGAWKPYGIEQHGAAVDALEFFGLLRNPIPYETGGTDRLTPVMYRSQIESLLQHVEFDLIHAHDWLTYEAGLHAHIASGKPLLCHVHSTEYDRACGGGGDERIRRLERVGLETADLVIAVSRYTADRVCRLYGIDPGRIRVVHNAYHLGGRHGRSPGTPMFEEPVVLFMGRMTCQKGPDIFLEVARRVLDRIPEVRFIMAGVGDLLHELVHRAARYGMENRVLFTGFLNRDEVSRVLSMSDILLAPSVSDPFNITVLEAMSRGLAAVVSSRSGVTEVVRHLVRVDFWDVSGMAKCIVTLLKNEAKLTGLRESARKEAGGITWNTAARKVRALYGELLC
jgi:glycosyltransferase involved in cell wall biosynthesis